MDCHVDISSLSTMRIGGTAKKLLTISDQETLVEFIQIIRNEGEDFLIVGGGSNIVFSEKLPELVIGKMEMKGVDVVSQESNKTIISASAGENWDEFVEFTVKQNLSGIEALSGIPGTVGASPIQNIGAYGREAKDAISHVEAFDLEGNLFVTFQNKDCEFDYRNSIFKKNPKRWIVTKVFFALHKERYPEMPKYKDSQEYFKDKQCQPLQSISKQI
jgi:UDP-N-acetylmuramate dehydrogenase